MEYAESDDEQAVQGEGWFRLARIFLAIYLLAVTIPLTFILYLLFIDTSHVFGVSYMHGNLTVALDDFVKIFHLRN